MTARTFWIAWSLVFAVLAWACLVTDTGSPVIQASCLALQAFFLGFWVRNVD